MTYIPIDEQMFDYICDYVDGTMESSVRDVFEQYLFQNPDVLRFVEQATEGRNLLMSLPRHTLPEHTRQRMKDQLQIKLIIEEAEAEEKAAPSKVSPAGLITFLSILVALFLLALLAVQ